MSSKRAQAVAVGGADVKGHTSDDGGDDHIDKKFKQVHGDGDEDEDEDEDEAPKTGKRAGRRKIKIEYIEDKSRRHITFSKRKSGIMKKAYELSTLTGTQVLLLVVSETGLVYTFTTPKLQPLVTKAEGKNLIQACLHAPDKETTPEPDHDGSAADGSEQEHEEESPSPSLAQLPSPQQQQQASMQQQPPPYSSPSMGMYPPGYNQIPYPTQPSTPTPYSYMGYASGAPNSNGQPPHPSSQHWAPSQQQQQQQQQQQVGFGASPTNPASAASKGGRGDK